MRHIRLKHHTPPQEWINKAEDSYQELLRAPDDDARKAIIDRDGSVWGELKDWLLSLSKGKCWFSEAKDCFSHWDVEHYRPKKSAKDLDGTEHPGYWWLAFNWTNFRICGNAGNRKKGTYFPLRDGCHRVTQGGDLRLEDPILLDPADPHDPSLLSFNVEGRAIPVAGCTDPWDIARVKYSVERYNLDFPALMDKRKLIWNECWTRIEQYRAELHNYHQTKSPVARQQAREKAEQIRAMIAEEVELSSVAKACIIGSGDPRIISLLNN